MRARATLLRKRFRIAGIMQDCMSRQVENFEFEYGLVARLSELIPKRLDNGEIANFWVSFWTQEGICINTGFFFEHRVQAWNCINTFRAGWTAAADHAKIALEKT